MAGPLPLKQKFEALLAATTHFFAAEQAEGLEDRRTIDELRTLALDVAVEANDPQRFERFIAYLMGTTTIAAHYSLQAIQMMCLTIHALRNQAFKTGEREELATAAFFADFGLRAAWLRFQQEHCNATVHHLKLSRFPWWTLTLERMIQNHHSAELDISPRHILPVIAHYLALTRGTGTDSTPESLMLPARAVDVIMTDETLDKEAKKIFLEAVSVYPLGSWVRLNTTETGLVVANLRGNPLRPVVGVFRTRAAESGSSRESVYQEVDLKKEVTRFIAGEALPDSTHEKIFDHASLWIPDWDGRASGIPLVLRTEDVDPASAIVVPVPQTTRAVKAVPSILAAPPLPVPPPAPSLSLPPTAKAPLPPEAPAAAPVQAVHSNAFSEHVERFTVLVGQRVEACQLRWPMDAFVFSEAIESFRRALQGLSPVVTLLTSLEDPIGLLASRLLNTWTDEMSAQHHRWDHFQGERKAWWNPWQRKRQEIEEWLVSVREAESNQDPTAALPSLTSHWRTVLAPEAEAIVSSLCRRWEQEYEGMTVCSHAIHEKIHVAGTLQRSLNEKTARTYLARGIHSRKDHHYEQALVAFEQARARDPQLDEASLYVQLCRSDLRQAA
jgi:hypothetical protein